MADNDRRLVQHRRRIPPTPTRQMIDHPLRRIPDVRSPLPEIRIVHPSQHLHVLPGHFTKRRIRIHVILADPPRGLVQENRILQNQEVDLEDLRVLGPNRHRQPLL